MMDCHPILETPEQEEALDLWNKRTACVRDFAAAVGKDGGAVQMRSVLSPTILDHEVVLTLPSFDLGLKDEEASSNPLPVIGEHREAILAAAAAAGEDIPAMAASVLTGAVDGVPESEQQAAKNIGKVTSWTKSTLEYAAHAAQKNLSESFESLIKSRVRAWTLLLLRHSLSTGDDESRSRLLKMLSSSIKVGSAEAQFKTLKLPSNAAMGTPKDGDVILPLLFEVHLNAVIQGTEDRATLRAPGTITACFEEGRHYITKVAVQLKTPALVNSMVEQARMLVLKTVASATKTNVPGTEPTPLSSSTEKPVVNPGINLGGFRSALNLSSSQQHQQRSSSPRLQKAQSSALRLNSVLNHKPPKPEDGNLGIRKTRSVKWESPVTAPKLGGPLAPCPKKARKAANAAKLKSFKSFGRPHGGSNSGPRNATFGEFGGPSRFWGRDGRLAHHPQPMQAEGTDLMGQPEETPSSNATFDLSQTLPRVGGGAMPRSTTALEMFMLSKSQGGKAKG